MKSYKPIQEAFRKLDQTTTSWFKSARFPRTMETANAVLYRNAVIDASTLAYLAHCLGLSNKQIIEILENYAVEMPKKAAEVAILKKLITPVELSSNEQGLVEKMRLLDDAKRKIILDMVGLL